MADDPLGDMLKRIRKVYGGRSDKKLVLKSSDLSRVKRSEKGGYSYSFADAKRKSIAGGSLIDKKVHQEALKQAGKKLNLAVKTVKREAVNNAAKSGV